MDNNQSIKDTLDVIRRALEDEDNIENNNEVLILNKKVKNDGTIETIENNIIDTDNINKFINEKISEILEKKLDEWLEKKLPTYIKNQSNN